jgi:hypothetical protein
MKQVGLTFWLPREAREADGPNPRGREKSSVPDLLAPMRSTAPSVSPRMPRGRCSATAALDMSTDGGAPPTGGPIGGTTP